MHEKAVVVVKDDVGYEVGRRANLFHDVVAGSVFNTIWYFFAAVFKKRAVFLHHPKVAPRAAGCAYVRGVGRGWPGTLPSRVSHEKTCWGKMKFFARVWGGVSWFKW